MENYFKKIKSIGYKKSFNLLNDRIHKVIFLRIKYKYISKIKLSKNYKPTFKSIKHNLMFDTTKFITQQEDINNFLKGEHRLFGHKFTKKLSWNEDFINNYKWKNDYYKFIRLPSFSQDKDPKVPLEYSRLNHLVLLSLLYKINKNKVYKEQVIKELIDWDIKNPLGKGISWACTMDVSLRAANIVVIYDLLSVKDNKEFVGFINNLLHQHKIFIRDNLENKNRIQNNHYLSNLVGLIFISVYFKNTKHGIELFDFAINELEIELIKQINKDGTNFEGSTFYHKFVFELLFYTKVLMDVNQISYNNSLNEILDLMYIFLKSIIKHSGEIPIIGDCDNGYFLNMNNYFEKNSRVSMTTIANYENYKSIDNLNINYRFDDGGYYLIKNSDIYIIIKCGKLGSLGYGGHSHNDQLSFELNILGKDFIVDPGTASYYGNHVLRNKTRETRAHNTLIVEGYEQNSFNEKKIFLLEEESYAKCENFTNHSFSGIQNGYVQKNGVIHRRKVIVNKCDVIIQDEINKIKDSPKITFNLHPDVKIITNKGELILQNDGVEIYIQTGDYVIEEGIYAYDYSNYVSTKRIVVPLKSKVHITKISFKKIKDKE